MSECHTPGCHGRGVISWPLLGDITLCSSCYANPPPEFAALVAESKAPPDDFDVPDDFDWDDSDEKVWITHEGERIPYGDLTDQHLINIVRYLRRAIHDVSTGYWPQGEMASLYLERDLARAESRLEELEAEASNRGLKVIGMRERPIVE